MIPNFVITITLAIALFAFSLVFRYYEDFRRATPESIDYKHAFTFFIRFLFVGALSFGLFIGLLIANLVVS